MASQGMMLALTGSRQRFVLLASKAVARSETQQHIFDANGNLLLRTSSNGGEALVLGDTTFPQGGTRPRRYVRMRNARRSILVVTLAMGMSITTVGCENIYMSGPYELGYDGQSLIVASCESREVETVYVEERAGGPNGRVLIWEASGQLLLNMVTC